MSNQFLKFLSFCLPQLMFALVCRVFLIPPFDFLSFIIFVFSLHISPVLLRHISAFCCIILSLVLLVVWAVPIGFKDTPCFRAPPRLTLPILFFVSVPLVLIPPSFFILFFLKGLGWMGPKRPPPHLTLPLFIFFDIFVVVSCAAQTDFLAALAVCIENECEVLPFSFF